jgi:low temperature requirement protein LtrA
MTTTVPPVTPAARPGAEAEGEQRVTALELFFDLVFVFAITQVTGFISADPTWTRLVEGLAIVVVLWWAWESYAWLTNTAASDEGLVRVTVFAVMGAMLIVSLAVPGAFGGDALLFAVAYAVVRVMHLALYAVLARDDPHLRAAIRRLAGPMLAGAALLIAAGLLDGTARGVAWAAAITVEVGGLLVRGVAGWRVHAGHFAERHALIVIIALGESIVALGVGAESVKLDAETILGALLGVAVAACIWWAYFDVVAIVAERRFHAVTGEARARMARDSYTYLHLPMVAGIILFALGVKKTLGHPGDALGGVPALALCGGVALYLVAHVLFRLRNVGTVNRQRIVAAAVLLGLAVLATHVPALLSLALVAAVTVALIAYEALHFAEARDRVRHAT